MAAGWVVVESAASRQKEQRGRNQAALPPRTTSSGPSSAASVGHDPPGRWISRCMDRCAQLGAAAPVRMREPGGADQRLGREGGGHRGQR
jgi:hypothetical protein